MTVPIEALAMAGVDYNEWGLDIEKWEDDDWEWQPPPHLLAEDEEGEEEEEEEEEEEDEPDRIVRKSIQNFREDFDADSDHNAINEPTGESEHRRAFRGGRTVVEKIKQTSRSRKLIIRIRYLMIMLLIITRIVGRKRFLKPT